MLTKHKALILFDFIAKGLFASVLSLFIVYKNVEISKLPLIMLFFSATVLIMEVPSGIFADSFGKKKCYQLSIALNILSSIIGLIGTTFWPTAAFAILLGLGKAFGSGSLDALLINHYIEQKGTDCLPKISSNMNILDGFGIAIGAMLGGYIALSISFESLLITRILIYVLTLISSFYVLKNIDSFPKNQNPLSLTKDAIALIKKQPELTLVLIFTLTIGIMILSLEIYWQLQFINLAQNQNIASYIGIVSFLGFSCSSLGSYLGGKYYKKLWHNPSKLFISFSILLALSLLALSLQNTLQGFVLCYILWYLVLGIGNVGEASLLNSKVPNYIRATILSLSSFALQIGALISSSISALLYTHYEIKGTFIIISLCSLIIFITTTLKLKLTNQKQQKTNP